MADSYFARVECAGLKARWEQGKIPKPFSEGIVCIYNDNPAKVVKVRNIYIENTGVGKHAALWDWDWHRNSPTISFSLVTSVSGGQPVPITKFDPDAPDPSTLGFQAYLFPTNINRTQMSTPALGGVAAWNSLSTVDFFGSYTRPPNLFPKTSPNFYVVDFRGIPARPSMIGRGAIVYFSRAPAIGAIVELYAWLYAHTLQGTFTYQIHVIAPAYPFVPILGIDGTNYENDLELIGLYASIVGFYPAALGMTWQQMGDYYYIGMPTLRMVTLKDKPEDGAQVGIYSYDSATPPCPDGIMVIQDFSYSINVGAGYSADRFVDDATMGACDLIHRPNTLSVHPYDYFTVGRNMLVMQDTLTTHSVPFLPTCPLTPYRSIILKDREIPVRPKEGLALISGGGLFWNEDTPFYAEALNAGYNYNIVIEFTVEDYPPDWEPVFVFLG